MNFRRIFCWTCGNRGFIEERGKPIEWDDLTSREQSLQILQGGTWFAVQRIPCPKCGRNNA